MKKLQNLSKNPSLKSLERENFILYIFLLSNWFAGFDSTLKEQIAAVSSNIRC